MSLHGRRGGEATSDAGRCGDGQEESFDWRSHPAETRGGGCVRIKNHIISRFYLQMPGIRFLILFRGHVFSQFLYCVWAFPLLHG